MMRLEPTIGLQLEVDAWVPCGVAYMAIGDEMARRAGCDAERGRAITADILASQLSQGVIRSRGLRFYAKSSEDLKSAWNGLRKTYGPDSGLTLEMLARGVIQATDEPLNAAYRFEDIKPTFWIDLTFSGELAQWEMPDVGPPIGVGWAIGSFLDQDGFAVRNVEFAVCDLPCPEAVRAIVGAGQPASASQARGGPDRSKGGRPPKPGYMNFAAELVALMLEDPALIDQPGATTRIAETILDRLAERGIATIEERQAREAVGVMLTRLGEKRGG